MPDLSLVQRHLLDLAHDGRVTHEAALQRVFGLVPCRGRRGGMIFDHADPKTHTARVDLSRSLERLARRRLIVRDRHGFKLACEEKASC